MLIQDNTPILPVNYMRIFVMIAESMGVDQSLILKDTGVNESDLALGNEYLSYQQYRKMKYNAQEYVKDPAFYMEYGASINLTEHGRLGHLAFSCPSFEEALKNTVKYIKILNRMYSLNAQFKGDIVKLEMDTILPGKDLYVSEMEPMMAALYKALTSIQSAGNKPTKVFFKYSEPSHSYLYSEYFGDYCVFDAKQNAIEFDTSAFKKYWSYGDPMIAKIAKKNLEQALYSLNQGESLAARIREVILGSSSRFPKQEEVAEVLHVTTRTLSRNLRKENKTYQEVVDELRQELAIDYLDNSNWSIEEIAELLGYSSAANFGRAFKKWTGKSPSDFRTVASGVNSAIV